jgi:Xylose isomerase-like TIM barrel
MRNIGFSTGAIALGDFHKALEVLAPRKLSSVELSALRMSEVETLVDAIPDLQLGGYTYISFHAPSSYSASEEAWLTDLLYSGVPAAWPIVLHPDAICDPTRWKRFGGRVAIENMDRRKTIGRTFRELRVIFEQLPEAGLCFDLGHARQYDSSMTEAFLMLIALRERLVQVHLSEVNSESQHESISYGAKLAFHQIAYLIPTELPIILESRVNPAEIDFEMESAREALSVTPTNQHATFEIPV